MLVKVEENSIEESMRSILEQMCGGARTPTEPANRGRNSAPQWNEVKSLLASNELCLREMDPADETFDYIDKIAEAASPDNVLYFHCRLCHKLMVYGSSGTMRRHLRDQHGLNVFKRLLRNRSQQKRVRKPRDVNDFSYFLTHNEDGRSESKLSRTSPVHDSAFEQATTSENPTRSDTPDAVADTSSESLPNEDNLKSGTELRREATSEDVRVKTPPTNFARPSAYAGFNPRSIRQKKARFWAMRAAKERQLALKAAAETQKVRLETMLMLREKGVERVMLKAGQVVDGSQMDGFGIRDLKLGAVVPERLFEPTVPGID